MIYVRGTIVAPDGNNENRREILVEDRNEYNKLPLDLYPITHISTPQGIGVKPVHGDDQCEASLHRYKKSSHYIYIGSAMKRLGSRDYTKKFREFLEKVGIVEAGTSVKLEFNRDKINISKI